MAGVTFDAVTKRYGDVTAVADLDLDITDGEFLVLLGPSGCGKTTALRMIAGLEDISEGTLTIGDRVVNDIDPRKRDVAMVFQSYALYPHQNVAKNIASPLTVREYHVDGENEPRKLTKAERETRIDEAARMLGLEPYLKRKPGALSGGQRQRVALARAIVARPQVFLMDEPLSNLDAKLRTQTRAELVDLHRRVGTTIVYVTHDQVEAMTMATRIAVLNDGRLQQVGTAEEVYDSPANLFVAGFIGTPPMNTFAARVSDDGREVIIRRGGNAALEAASPSGSDPHVAADAEEAGRLSLDDTNAALARSDSDVIVGVRPEHLHIKKDDEPHSDVITGVVHNVEWLGHEAVISVDVAGASVAVRQRADQDLPDVGATVALVPAPWGIHLFDPETTERLR
ncbi:MAG TPA: ABC transporter ATP-binding protein [Acidimicrobiales bacterium]|nr:ABC transporter ATP-binding protein [Acidimicrobiales bacterium]